jgi:hypothetical protein
MGSSDWNPGGGDGGADRLAGSWYFSVVPRVAVSAVAAATEEAPPEKEPWVALAAPTRQVRLGGGAAEGDRQPQSATKRS